ncbi:MAG: hypothetical protein ACKVJE_20105 [Pseudomonadales bacterium]
MATEVTKFDRSFHLASGVLISLSAPAILLFQVNKYLRMGTWVAISFLDALAMAGFKWAANPTDWLGVCLIRSR